jgi:hypothetical protein
MVMLVVALAVTIAILIIERTCAWWRGNLWRRQTRAERMSHRDTK